MVGHHRHDIPAELALLNDIWALQSQMTNYFLPQQKLISKGRDGAKVTKKYDKATTPHRRAQRHDTVSSEDKAILTDTYTDLNPAAIQRQIQALTARLLTLTTSKAAAVPKPVPRAQPLMSQRSRLRAHLDVIHRGPAPIGKATPVVDIRSAAPQVFSPW